MKADKEFFEGRYRLFETDGWKDLIEELQLMSESLDSVQTIKDEKSLYTVQGQLSILSMLITLEEQTKLIDTDNSITQGLCHFINSTIYYIDGEYHYGKQYCS